MIDYFPGLVAPARTLPPVHGPRWPADWSCAQVVAWITREEVPR